MPAIESIGFTVTAPGATLTEATPFPGDIATIRGAPDIPGAFPLAVTTYGNAAGIASIRRTSGNDLVRGYQFTHLGATPLTIAPLTSRQPSVPGEVIRVSLSGSATTGQTENLILTLYYPEAPAGDATLITPPELATRARREVTVFLTGLTSGASSWGPETSLTAQSDLLRGERAYALLGAQANSNLLAGAIRGPTTSNLRIGFPLNTDRSSDCTNYFLRLALDTGLQTIPVIRGSDRQAYQISIASRTTTTGINLTLYLVELD